MRITAAGAEWKAFYQDEAYWPEGAYHDDTDIMVDGVVAEDIDLSEVGDDATLTVRGGFVEINNRVVPLVDHFLAWRKGRTTRTLVIDVPPEHYDAVRLAAESAGGTVRAC
jgi:hypothetical protein